jgi:hypothetical protein
MENPNLGDIKAELESISHSLEKIVDLLEKIEGSVREPTSHKPGPSKPLPLPP